MVDFFDEVGSRELCELISDGLFAVLRESAESLLDQFCSFFDIKRVLDHLPWDTRHVRGFPSKDVLVCLKEGDERAFLFVIETCPDHSRLGWIGWVERDLFDILFGADPSFGCFLCRNFSLVLKGGGGEPDGILVSFCPYVLC